MNEPRKKAHGPIRPEVRATMLRIADVIGKATPPGFGFCLFMFDMPTDATGQQVPGHISYISNAERPDMILALKDWLANQEAEGK